MQIPQSVQDQLTQQQEQQQQQALALRQAESTFKDSLVLPDLPESDVSRRWLKKVKTEENRVEWIPVKKARQGKATVGDKDTEEPEEAADASVATEGQKANGSGEGESISEQEIEELEREGYVRCFTPAKSRQPGDRPTLTFNRAEVGYPLVLPVPGTQQTKPARQYLENLREVSQFDFQAKKQWFSQVVGVQMRVPWEKGHKKIYVRRSHLLEDSFTQLRSMKREEMRQIFRFEFQGEEAQDAGGVAREWFTLVSKALFDAGFGLFKYSATDNVTYQINPLSGVANPDHLEWFRFAGRLLGKALMDGQLVHANLALPLHKHILGVPVCLSDLEFIDRDVHSNMMKMLAMDGDMIEHLCLDFTASEEYFGDMRTVELKPGGADIPVTKDNATEYVRLQLRRLLFENIQEQLGAMLDGLYDVVPQHLLFMFDYQELELLLCGLPQIDVDDWQAHCEYRGEYNNNKDHPVIEWFWRTVRDFSGEEKARLLQFATGSSRVPAQGFGALTSYDGTLRFFCVASISKAQCIYPRAHTCFNRIDLPLYDTFEELNKYLGLVINMDITGFDME